MSERCYRRWLCATLAGLIAAAFSAAAARAETVAYWKFESGSNFLADSSGNGHALANNGATTSSDAAVGSGSAQFNGSAIMQTIGKLDLSPYKTVTVSWWQKSSSADDGILCEHTSDSSANGSDCYGGFYIYNPNNAACEAMLRGVNGPKAPPVYVDDYAFTASTDWVQMSVTFDLQASQPSDVIQITRSGTAGGTDTYTNSLPDSFANDYFFIGARGSGASYGYIGLVDELMVFGTPAVPEPGTICLLFSGVFGLLAYAWRRRRHTAV